MLLCLSLFFHSLPPPSFLPPLISPPRAPPTQLLNGKVCPLPPFTTVSVYPKLLSLTWDALQLLVWWGLQLIHSYVHRLPEHSAVRTPLGFKDRLHSEHMHLRMHVVWLIALVEERRGYILPMWCRKIPGKHADRSPIHPLWVACCWRHVTICA